MIGSFPIENGRGNRDNEAWGFRYDGAIHWLPGLPGYTGVRPAGVNDIGVVVGRLYCVVGSCAPLPEEVPVLWRNDQLYKLKDLLPPLNGTIYSVSDINNRGQLLFQGQYNDIPGGGTAAIIATPKNVPVGDISVDCIVGADDLMLLLESWGPRETALVRQADLDGDGEIGAVDLGILLGAWSPTR
jgi:hypothetical protein